MKIWDITHAIKLKPLTIVHIITSHRVYITRASVKLSGTSVITTFLIPFGTRTSSPTYYERENYQYLNDSRSTEYECLFFELLYWYVCVRRRYFWKYIFLEQFPGNCHAKKMGIKIISFKSLIELVYIITQYI